MVHVIACVESVVQISVLVGDVIKIVGPDCLFGTKKIAALPATMITAPMEMVISRIVFSFDPLVINIIITFASDVNKAIKRNQNY